MKSIMKKILNKKSENQPQKTIEQETNDVFNKYKKSFKDLALYDRGEKIQSAN